MQLSQDTSPVWDLTKATFTSLALLGLTGGCSSKPDVAALINSRPQSTATNVIDEKEMWIGKEVTINAKPVLISDQSKLYYDGMKHGDLYVFLNLQYRLESPDALPGKELYMVDCRSICVTRQFIDPKNLAADHILPETTHVVSGRVEKYANADQVYLRYMNSMYRAPETSQTK